MNRSQLDLWGLHQNVTWNQQAMVLGKACCPMWVPLYCLLIVIRSVRNGQWRASVSTKDWGLCALQNNYRKR